MKTGKPEKPLVLNGAPLSLSSKAAESLRRNRSSLIASNTSSGINSPTILSNRSDKTSSRSDSTPPIKANSNPYLQPKNFAISKKEPNFVSSDNSIDEYWLGFSPKTVKNKGNAGNAAAAAGDLDSICSGRSPVLSGAHGRNETLNADSLNEFIELEHTIQKEIDQGAALANGPVQIQNVIKATGSSVLDKEKKAAVVIQRWFRRRVMEKNAAASPTSLHMLMKEKHRQYSSALVADRNYTRKLTATATVKKGGSTVSDQGKALRQKAVEELRALREQRRKEIERKAKDELAKLQSEGKVNTKPNRQRVSSSKMSMAKLSRSRTSSVNSNAVSNVVTDGDIEVFDNAFDTAFTDQLNKGEALSSSVAIARTKSTLEDLLTTLHQLETDSGITANTSEEEIKPPSNKTLAWLEEVEKNTSSRVDAVVSSIKMSPRSPKTNASQKFDVSMNKTESASVKTNKDDLMDMLPAPISQQAESVTSYLNGVESSHRRIGDIDDTMAKQEEEIKVALKNMNSAAKIADLQQLEKSSAEITSKCLQQQAELEAKQHTIKMLQTALNQQRDLTARQAKELERDSKKQMEAQRNEYESAIQRHLGFIDQLIEDKKALTEKCEKLVTETRELERKSATKLKELEEQHVVEIKKIREFEQAAEKLRREKWIAEREKRIKEATVKGLEPEIQRLIAQHKEEIRKLKSQHDADLLASDERAAQKYVKLVEELRQQLADEKEEACRRERELAKQRYESALTQERMQLQQTEKRLYSEIASERERLSDQNQRQRGELDSLQRQLEETHRSALELMRQEYDKAKKDQEDKHSKELRDFEERVKIEKQMWEEQYMKKQETWLMTKERELKEKVRVERDRDIEAVISQLETDTRRQREEVERSAENRVKRLREKYDSEINELERSERQTLSKYNETKGRLAESEGELEHFKATLRQKEAELNDLTSDLQKLRDERGRVADIVRQELADRLVAVEEENGRMKAELAEQRARSKAESDRLREEISTVQRSKEVELDEIHQRVKQAISKKEEVVTQLRQQYEAATRRADHLEGLLEQQRKQLMGIGGHSTAAGASATARSGASVAHSISSKK